MTVRPAVVVAALVASGAITSAQALRSASPAPTPSQIFLAPFKDGPGRTIQLLFLGIQSHGFDVGKPLNITNNRGDDDEPCFLADSSGLLFSSNRDGKQRDVYRYDIASKAAAQVTSTADDEHSPVPAPDGRTFSAVRGLDRRLWRFNLDGSDAEPTPLHPGPIADYVWMSATHIAAFLREPRGVSDVLHLVNLGTGTSDIIASNGGRFPRVRSGTGTLTFVQTTPAGDSVIDEFNPATKKIEELAPILDGSDDFAWTPYGALMMGANSKVFVREDETDRWIEVANLRKAGVTGIRRIVVSPNGKWVAIVASKSASQR